MDLGRVLVAVDGDDDAQLSDQEVLRLAFDALAVLALLESGEVRLVPTDLDAPLGGPLVDLDLDVDLLVAGLDLDTDPLRLVTHGATASHESPTTPPGRRQPTTSPRG